MSEVFAAPRATFEAIIDWLDSPDAASFEHGALEQHLDRQGRDLLRQLFQSHLDLRAVREQRRRVVDADGVRHGAVEAGHQRRLGTIFGAVTVTRLAYRHRGHSNLHPADAELNLPVERHSHGLRRLAALEAARGSFQDAVEAVARASGQPIGKRQLEQLTQAAAIDADAFYATRTLDPVDTSDVLVLSADGKGIVMRPDALRPLTAAKAQSAKLQTRLSKGEKRNRKRLAEVGAVYDLEPVPRTPAQIMATNTTTHPPRAKNKWLTASIVDDAATVVAAVFDEAERRDPTHTRTWVGLVDGNNHQIERLQTEAATRGITLTIIIDFIHVLEYLWDAAWCFFPEADPAAETWVQHRALAILNGHAPAVATGIRRRATTTRLTKPDRAKADRAARYLDNKTEHLDYPTALASGWPIATGVIEGACRHLVKDRMDITGARWGLHGAQAILTLRALHTNGDLDNYWTYHLQQERHRNHDQHYTAA